MSLKLLFVGACNVDTVLMTGGPLPTGGGKFKATQDISFGGGGLNASVACAGLANIFNHSHGISIMLATKLGGGADSVAAQSYVAARGVHVFDALNGDPASNIPHNTVISGTDERMIFVPPHQYPETPQASLDTLLQAIDGSHIVHIHSRAGDLAIKAAQIADSLGKTIVVDASGHDATLDQVMRFATHAALPDELILSDQTTGPQAVMNYMLSFKNIRHAAVMCGEDPTWLRNEDGTFSKIPVVSTSEFSVVDKLGAGDAARGALVLNMGLGASFRDAVRHANRVGTYSCAFLDRRWLEALRQNPTDIDRLVGAFRYDDLHRLELAA